MSSSQKDSKKAKRNDEKKSDPSSGKETAWKRAKKNRLSVDAFMTKYKNLHAWLKSDGTGMLEGTVTDDTEDILLTCLRYFPDKSELDKLEAELEAFQIREIECNIKHAQLFEKQTELLNKGIEDHQAYKAANKKHTK